MLFISYHRCYHQCSYKQHWQANLVSYKQRKELCRFFELSNLTNVWVSVQRGTKPNVLTLLTLLFKTTSKQFHPQSHINPSPNQCEYLVTGDYNSLYYYSFMLVKGSNMQWSNVYELGYLVLICTVEI